MLCYVFVILVFCNYYYLVTLASRVMNLSVPLLAICNILKMFVILQMAPGSYSWMVSSQQEENGGAQEKVFLRAEN